MSVIKDVEQFNLEVIGIDRIKPESMDQEEFGFFVGCLQEEISELEEAHGQDFIAEVDSIIDLVYFAIGGLCRMGIPASVQVDLFKAVHFANMQKNRGEKTEREKSHSLDAVKPADWVGPEEVIANILDDYVKYVHNMARKPARVKPLRIDIDQTSDFDTMLARIFKI